MAKTRRPIASPPRARGAVPRPPSRGGRSRAALAAAALLAAALLLFLLLRPGGGDRAAPSNHPVAEAGSLPDAPSAQEQALIEAARRAAPGDPAPARALGDFHARAGRPFSALWEYGRALHADPDDAATALACARALDTALLRDAAIARLRGLLARDPAHAEAAAMLAELYLRTGRPAEGLEALSAAPSPPELLRGRLLQAAGDASGARAAYRRAAAAGSPEAAAAWHRLGLLELAEGRRPEALAALEKAAAAAPAEPRIRVDLARARAEGGSAADRQAALALLEPVARERPYAPAFLEAGRLLAAEGRLPQALGALGRATAADPNLADARQELARVLERMGRRAEGHYERALAFSIRDLRVRALREYLQMAAADPSRPDGLLLASQSHFKMQQNTRGVAVARRAYERFPDRPEVREQFAAMLILANDRKGAAAQCRAWLEKAPEAAAPLRMLGRIAASDLRFEEAIDYYEQALSREPENPDFMIALGETLLDAPGADRLPRAIALLSRAAARAPNDARARYHLGIALMRAERPEEARRQLLRTLDLDPHRGPTYSTLVQLARRLREPGPVALFGPIVRQVEDRLREELALWKQTWDHPDDPDGYLALARFLIRTADPARAEAQLEEALRLRPAWPEARAELSRARRLLAAF